MSVIPAAKNNPDDIKIRKFRDTLVTGGYALIGFGVWTVIRSVLEISQESGDFITMMTYEGFTDAEVTSLGEMLTKNPQTIVILITILVFLVADLAIRIYVGLSARAIGLQKKNKHGKEKNGIVWLIFGFLLAIIGAYSLYTTLLDAEATLRVHSVIYFVVQVFVDATSLFITVELVITAIRLRCLLKKQNDIEEVRDAA